MRKYTEEVRLSAMVVTKEDSKPTNQVIQYSQVQTYALQFALRVLSRYSASSATGGITTAIRKQPERESSFWAEESSAGFNPGDKRSANSRLNTTLLSSVKPQQNAARVLKEKGGYYEEIIQARPRRWWRG